MEIIFQNVYKLGEKLLTKNRVPRVKVYGEEIIKINGVEYRVWDKYRSKLAAAIHKGLKNFWFNGDVLYLGASSGTTVSHLSDIIDNYIYAVEISKPMIIKLYELAKLRYNIIPILADANYPENYKDIEKIDVIYQDIAQPNQLEIFFKNVEFFKPKYGYLCLKLPSISIKSNLNEIIRNQIYKPLEVISLEPFDKQHYFLTYKFL